MSNDTERPNDEQQNRSRPFYKLYKEPMHEANQVFRVPGRIFLFSLRNMDDHNVVRAEHTEIADHVHASRSHVSRVLRNFERSGFIVLGRGQYIVNPKFAYVGVEGTKTYNTACKLYHQKRSQKDIPNEVVKYAE